MRAEHSGENTAAIVEEYNLLRQDTAIAPILRLMSADFSQPAEHAEEISWLLELTRSITGFNRYARLRRKLAQAVGMDTQLIEIYLNSMRSVRMSRSFRNVRASSPDLDEVPEERQLK